MGDKLIFYVTSGRDPGYVALGTVKVPLLLDSKPLWPDDVYPFRIGITARAILRWAVPRSSVMRELGATRLKHQRPQSVIPLTDREYRLIEGLILAELNKA